MTADAPLVPIIKGSRPTSNYVPLVNSVFATATTFLGQALRVTLHDSGSMTFSKDPLLVYVLAGATVLLYWSKISRILQMTTRLIIVQQLIIGIWLLLIILLPTTISMAFMHRGAEGSVWDWTAAQTCNTIMLGTYLVIDICCVIFTGLLNHSTCNEASSRPAKRALLINQVPCLIVLILLMFLLLFNKSFNDEFAYIVPLALVIEEGLMYLNEPI